MINGELGIIDPKTQNKALFTKWIWLIQYNPESLWASMVGELHGVTTVEEVQFAVNYGSSFMKNLADLLSFLRCSVEPGNVNKWRLTEAGEFNVIF